MAAVEILGDKMHKVFKELGIHYTKTYSKRCNPKKNYDPHYEVYEISHNDMKVLENAGVFKRDEKGIEAFKKFISVL